MLMSNLPTVKCAVMAWATKTTVWVSAKRQQDFETVESYQQMNVAIFRTPVSQKLDMKKEGQRQWKEETIFTDTALNLKPDDIIIFDCANGQKYRILDKIDWASYGYYEYQITSDYHS